MIDEAAIVRSLNTNPLAVEKAMLILLSRQTDDEKRESEAKYRNNRGFGGNTVTKGTYFAKWVASGRHLTGHHLERARKIAIHHRKQLLEVAIEKAKNR